MTLGGYFITTCEKSFLKEGTTLYFTFQNRTTEQCSRDLKGAWETAPKNGSGAKGKVRRVSLSKSESVQETGHVSLDAESTWFKHFNIN